MLQSCPVTDQTASEWLKREAHAYSTRIYCKEERDALCTAGEGCNACTHLHTSVALYVNISKTSAVELSRGTWTTGTTHTQW